MVGTRRAVIRAAILELLDEADARARMAAAGRSVYGDGFAARRIVDAVAPNLGGPGRPAAKALATGVR
jgi:UDP-N-acetylglucosamine 2-epimerase